MKEETNTAVVRTIGGLDGKKKKKENIGKCWYTIDWNSLSVWTTFLLC